MTTLCRVAFCPVCAKEGRPKTDQDCLFYGATSRKYYVRGAWRVGIPGFTPHIIKLIRVDNENNCILYEKTCSMSDCTTDKTRGIMPTKQWNAWVNYKHDRDYDI